MEIDILPSVQIPIDHVPVFPPCCVKCGRAPAEQEIRVGTSSIRWYSPAFWGAGPKIAVPACESCTRQLRFLKQIRYPLYISIALVGCGAAIALSALGFIDGQTAAGLFWGSLALAAIGLPFLIGHLFADPCSWEARSNWPAKPTHLAFEFESREYARAFAEANHSSVDS